jgi:outer membrane protein assembly factor BamE (lipoprotein component of BamABCDE complex)
LQRLWGKNNSSTETQRSETMKRHILLVGVLCLLLAFSACGFKSMKQGATIDEKVVKSSIIDGKTTKSDVVLEFGPPTKTMENEKMFFYTWSETSKSSIPLYGGETTITNNLIILFDDSGVVKSHKITKTSAESKSGFGAQKDK